jgi:ABC-type uncharacterized transport system substrate-binding protein
LRYRTAGTFFGHFDRLDSPSKLVTSEASLETNFDDQYRNAAGYVIHINGRETRRSAGAIPSKYELVINLKAANALGLTVPTSLLAAPTR